MGKKRIKLVDLAETEKKPKKKSHKIGRKDAGVPGVPEIKPVEQIKKPKKTEPDDTTKSKTASPAKKQGKLAKSSPKTQTSDTKQTAEKTMITGESEKRAAKADISLEASKSDKPKEESSTLLQAGKTKKLQKTPSLQTGKKAKRSRRYQSLKAKIKKQGVYALEEAVDLVNQIAKAKFDETVEVHLVLNLKKKGERLSGEAKLPHGTGKTRKVAIANDKLLGEIEKGKIDFDVLLSSPEMMPKLARYARLLGPKGLMPNPKHGTVTDNPQEKAKEFEAGKIQYKSEAKAPLIHQSIGKASFKPKQITENLKALVMAVGLKNIKKAVLTTTMGPGLKLDINTI